MASTPTRNFSAILRAPAFVHRSKVSVTAATLSVKRYLHSGRTTVANLATGFTYTLPATSGSGNRYRFVIGTTLTSGTGIIKVANATDVFVGGVLMNDIGDSSAALADYQPTASTSDTITFTASIGGGKAGDWFDLEDIATGKWAVNGVIQGITDPTSPFSATVS